MKDQRSIVIIGGGISGLALGAYIKDGGFNSIILEKSKTAGGKISTISKEGYLLEMGASSTPTNLALEEMAKILGLDNQLITQKSSKKSILKKGKLKPLGNSPKEIMLSSLLSSKGKSQFYSERFKKANQAFEEETLGQFFERRFGKEFVTYVVDPMAAKFFGGDAYQLSMQSVLPKLLELEAQYGSITKSYKKDGSAFRDAKIVSFKGGMQSLIDALIAYIGDENILKEINAKTVRLLENGQYAIELYQEGIGELEIIADVVVFATPSNVTADFIKPISKELAGLMYLHHPKISVVHLGYDISAFNKPYNGEGFWVPSTENKSFLGMVANSNLFEHQAPAQKKLFTLYIGGTRDEQQLNQEGDVFIEKAIKEFETILGITKPAELKEIHNWDNAIPQYGIGHQALLEGIDFFQSNTRNLHILGSFRSGISVADCIAGAKKTHGQLIKDYSKQSYQAIVDEEKRKQKK